MVPRGPGASGRKQWPGELALKESVAGEGKRRKIGRGAFRAICFFAMVLLIAISASAQMQPSLHRVPEEMRVRVNLVNVVASVLDPSGKPVPDLPRQAFALFQDGREQRIDLFERQTDLPLDLALMIDTSLSTYDDLKFEREAAERFVLQVLRPGDRMAVFTFAYNVNQLSPFTGDVSTLDDALRGIQTGTGTSLFDAIYLGSHALAQGPPDRRRVLLLVTDAGETTSRTSYEAARDAAVRAGTMLYTILIRSVKSDAGRNTAGEHAIDTIIDSTGGAMFTVDTPSQFQTTFERINEELRTEYLLGYYPVPVPQPGTFHSIELRLEPPGPAPGTRYSLEYRQQYYAPEGGQ
jgi:Ca-activated chloride channel homolog